VCAALPPGGLSTAFFPHRPLNRWDGGPCLACPACSSTALPPSYKHSVCGTATGAQPLPGRGGCPPSAAPPRACPAGQTPAPSACPACWAAPSSSSGWRGSWCACAAACGGWGRVERGRGLVQRPWSAQQLCGRRCSYTPTRAAACGAGAWEGRCRNSGAHPAKAASSSCSCATCSMCVLQAQLRPSAELALTLRWRATCAAGTFTHTCAQAHTAQAHTRMHLHALTHTHAHTHTHTHTRVCRRPAGPAHHAARGQLCEARVRAQGGQQLLLRGMQRALRWLQRALQPLRGVVVGLWEQHLREVAWGDAGREACGGVRRREAWGKRARGVYVWCWAWDVWRRRCIWGALMLTHSKRCTLGRTGK